MSFVLCAFALLLLLWARSAVRRRGLWAPAMVASEAGGLLIVIGAAVLVVFRSRGWAGGPFGTTGQVALGIAMVGFGVAVGRGIRSPKAAAAAATQMIGTDVAIGWRPLIGLVAPVAIRPRRMVERAGIRYGPHERHLLDHLSLPTTGPKPALIYVHGGGWWRGRRNTQARPLLYALVAAGWHVFTPSYRLSPDATFPDHLVDVKRSIAWVREHASELGVDPDFVAVAGGSTGGNLAALAALTGNQPEYQRDFTASDTSVQVCVPLYGVHDMLRRDGSPLWPYLSTSVMKSAPETDPAAWTAASPVRIASADRPPFFIVHGDADSLVGVHHSRRLAAALAAGGGPPTEVLEVRHANHGFDFFAGVRGRSTAAAVVAVLQHQFERGGDL